MKSIPALVFIFLPLAAAAPVSAIVVNFETFPNSAPIAGGTQITNQFASLGVTFSSVAPVAAQITNVLDFVPTTSPPNCLAPGGPTGVNGGTLILNFSPAVSNVGSIFVDDQFPVQVTAFGPGNAVVGVTTSDGLAGGTFDSWSIGHAAGIVRVEMVGGYFNASSPDGWAIDDLMFIPVPEPCTCVPATALLMAFAIHRRRLP